MSTKSELRSTTQTNYLYIWNHNIRDTFGKKIIKDVKYSDVTEYVESRSSRVQIGK